MRVLNPSTARLATALFFFFGLISAYDCRNARVDDTNFNLKELGGRHSLGWVRGEEYTSKYKNTTFTFDICDTLSRQTDRDKQCPSGTHICAIEDTLKSDGSLEDEVTAVVPIAGEYTLSEGKALDPKWTRLSSSEHEKDKGKEGIRLEMAGKTVEGIHHKAVVDFICIPKEKESQRARRDEKEGDDGDISKDHPEWKEAESSSDGNGGTISFVSFGVVDDGSAVKQLALEWKTPYACEGADSDPDLPRTKSGWGFWSILFLIMFLVLISYFAFFSWVNYNKYGARGWDLLPHSDTLRDLPYILADLGRKVVGTVSGGGSRSGYSAV